MSGATFQLLLAGGELPPSIDFAFGGALASSTSVSIGLPDTKRILVAVVPSGITPTIDGNAMTLQANIAGGFSMYSRSVPTGTSVTFAVSPAALLAALYVLQGMDGITAFATGTASNTLDINVPENGAVIAAFNSNNVVSFTAGVTSDVTINDGSGAPPFKTIGHAGIFSSAQTPLTVSGTGGGLASQRLVAASWGP